MKRFLSLSPPPPPPVFPSHLWLTLSLPFHGALGLAADPLAPSHLACAKPPAIIIKVQAASQLLAPCYVANKKPGL